MALPWLGRQAAFPLPAAFRRAECSRQKPLAVNDRKRLPIWLVEEGETILADQRGEAELLEEPPASLVAFADACVDADHAGFLGLPEKLFH
jgi:hypothetical protein